MRTYNIPVFIPHEGCPHDCLFCNQRKITGVQTSVTPEMVSGIVENYLSYLPHGEKHVEVAFFGGSFTGLSLDLQERFYQAANAFGDRIDGIRLSTRPDYINGEILSLAKGSGVSMIELGAQSASDAVLLKNNRGHTFAHTVKAVSAIRKAGIGVGLQMMTGMYGSDFEADVRSAEKMAELNPDCVRIYPVLVLKETHLADLYQKGVYQPQSLEEAVERAKEVLGVFLRRSIPVIRLGLHAGEDLREEGAVLAGPFHPALGELVESRLKRDELEKEFRNAQVKDGIWSVTVPEKQVSQTIGHKRCNVQYFQEKYGIQLSVKIQK